MLTFESTGKVGEAARRAMREELAALDRTWWRGKLGLEEEGEGPRSTLSGRVPLFHRHGVSDADDLYMAFADAAFVLERLADWAKRFKIKWHVRMNDEDWGAVDPSGYTPPLLDQMRKWARRVRVPSGGKGVWHIPEGRREELLQRHPGRKV